MKQIIIINGSGGVGKDTFVEYCTKYIRVLNISSVDKVKQAATILTGWNGEKDEKSRKLLSDLKEIGINYNDAPLQYICSMVEEFQQSENELMFIHIREGKEIEKCKNTIQAKTLLVTNKNVLTIVSNHSDKEVEEYTYDYHIANDGTLEELENVAKEFIEKLRKDYSKN
ncbi:MAG: hypothetical protein HFJ28_02685 [Clostridia bacterium]|jgi:dephospho-CoA kinase|nr:hypothetical protein [Clostridia bacterium]